jgi:3-oxoacyl-[acyl-carrier protein] reductase
VADAQAAVGRPVVIVTGVSRQRGIAAAVVRKLAASGWDVVLTGWPAYDETVSWGGDTGAAGELISEAAAAGARAVYVPADLSRVDAIAAVFDRAQEARHGLDERGATGLACGAKSARADREAG